MIEDRHILIERIDDTTYYPSSITPEYLDKFYLGIYELMFPEEPYPDVKEIVQLLTEFIREVGIYLNTQGPAPIITTAKVRVSSGEWSTTFRMGGDVRIRFGLLEGQDVLVKLLNCQHVPSPQPWYELSQCPANNFSGNGHGVRGLYTEMQKVLGYRECVSCKYSDDPAQFCGMGMEMYTGKCMKKSVA